MIKRYSYAMSCPHPELRFHIEHTVQDIDPSIYQEHTHDFAELVLVRHGRGTHIIADREYPLAPGDVFVINPNQVHGYKNLERIYVCNIMYDPAIYLPNASDLKGLPGYYALFNLEPLLSHEPAFKGRLRLHDEQMLHVYELLGPLEEEYIAQQPGYELIIRCYFKMIVTYIARQFAAQETASSRELVALSRVLAHVKSQYADPITLQDLADIANMSKNSLLRAFNRCYNTTPIDYLNRYRLEIAKELLSTTQSSITEIAFTVGFSDSNYFSRRFRQQYAVRPRAYQKGIKVEKPEAQ